MPVLTICMLIVSMPVMVVVTPRRVMILVILFVLVWLTMMVVLIS